MPGTHMIDANDAEPSNAAAAADAGPSNAAANSAGPSNAAAAADAGPSNAAAANAGPRNAEMPESGLELADAAGEGKLCKPCTWIMGKIKGGVKLVRKFVAATFFKKMETFAPGSNPECIVFFKADELMPSGNFTTHFSAQASNNETQPLADKFLDTQCERWWRGGGGGGRRGGAGGGAGSGGSAAASRPHSRHLNLTAQSQGHGGEPVVPQDPRVHELQMAGEASGARSGRRRRRRRQRRRRRRRRDRRRWRRGRLRRRAAISHSPQHPITYFLSPA
jgi:hypothetical protein